MPDPLIFVVLVMLLSGMLGGTINYFLAQPDPAESTTLARSMVIGTGAAFMVPLFLNMISSNLLDVIRGSTNAPPDYSKLFVFAGFCLVAAISSRAFIHTMSDRVLREAREAKREALSAKEEVADVQAVIKPIVDKETEGDDSGQPERVLRTLDEQAPDARVLRALVPRRWTLRSASGVAKEANLDKVEAIRVLDDLTDKGWVGRRTGDNGPRWFLTEAGRQVIGMS